MKKKTNASCFSLLVVTVIFFVCCSTLSTVFSTRERRHTSTPRPSLDNVLTSKNVNITQYTTPEIFTEITSRPTTTSKPTMDLSSTPTLSPLTMTDIALKLSGEKNFLGKIGVPDCSMIYDTYLSTRPPPEHLGWTKWDDIMLDSFYEPIYFSGIVNSIGEDLSHRIDADLIPTAQCRIILDNIPYDIEIKEGDEVEGFGEILGLTDYEGKLYIEVMNIETIIVH